MKRVPMLAGFLVALLLLAPGADARDPLEEEIRVALGTQGIPGQAETLARLAWSPETRHELAAHARNKLVLFGQHGMQAIADALLWADPAYSADITLASREAERQMTAGVSPASGAAIDSAIWYGSPDAKRIALDRMRTRPIGVLLLAAMDTSYEYPQLTPIVIDVLAGAGDDRARFFLAERMELGDADTRRRAAEALAAIGGQSLQYLRAWALADNAELRAVALRALLPHTTVGDLTTLYEYITMYPEDDANLLAALQSRAQVLEAMFEAQQEIDSRSPQLDD